MAGINRQVTLASRPVGFPTLSDFKLLETPVPTPDDGQVLIRALYLTVDPYMRGRMNARRSYAAPVEIGAVMTGEIAGEVVESRHPDFQQGDHVAGRVGWQEYAVADGSELRRVDTGSAPLSTALGVLGMPGLTAYFGLLEIGQPQAGETVVVCGAAGAVGSAVGQIAKIKGCRAVGIAGSDEKVAYVTSELGFDAAFNYKTVDNYVEALRKMCPDGVDVYFDNVGGEITDAVFQCLNVRARVAVCGQISQYNLKKPEPGPRLLWKLIEKQARVEGFLVFQFADRYAQGLADLTQWVAEGKIKYREQFSEGIESAPEAFLGMLKGSNIGKQLVKIAEPSV